MKRQYIVIALFVLLIAAGIYLFLRKGNKTPQLTSESTPTASEKPGLEQVFGTKIPEDFTKIDLKDTTGGNASGIAARKFENSKFELTILADLPELKANEVYHAWAENKNADILALGQLYQAKGGWILDYESNQDKSEYNDIIISHEEENVTKPRNEILKGSF